MKSLVKLFVVSIILVAYNALCQTSTPSEYTNGFDLVNAMRAKYEGKWFEKFKIEQKVRVYRNGTVAREEVWTECIQLPGRVRSIIGDQKNGNFEISRGDSQFVYQNHKLVFKRKGANVVLLLGFDIYVQGLGRTYAQLKEEGFDLTRIHETIWQGRPVYVVGAQRRDSTANQFWVDKDLLVTVRVLFKRPSGMIDIELNKLAALGKGWIATELLFRRNGKLSTKEEYLDYRIVGHIDTVMFTDPGWRMRRVVFGTYAEDMEELYWARVLVESLHSFGGCFGNAPLWIYIPENRPEMEKAIPERQPSFGVTIKKSRMPPDAEYFFFSGKVYASARAEADAEREYDILIWLDPDNIIVGEPREFFLPDRINFGYRPVMHKRIGSAYAEPLDEFWKRVYDLLSVPQERIFAMVTPVDQVALRPYFNAGMLIVRPERGILRKWPKAFETLYRDPIVKDMCTRDRTTRIFLHQAALAGIVLNLLTREEMMELPAVYNYPLSLHNDIPSERRPISLDSIVTLRYDVMFRDSTWAEKIQEPSQILQWIKRRFPGKQRE